MPVRSWFPVLAALATITGGMGLIGATTAAFADEVQAGQVLPAQNTPAAPLIPYSGNLSLRADESATKNTDPSLTTLAPAPTNTNGLDEVEIAPRKTLMLSSQSTWEKGFDNLAAAFKQLDEIVMAAGFDVVGRPFAVFTETDDAGFRFDAMLPVSTEEAGAKTDEVLQQAATEYAAGSEAKKPLPVVRLGESPSGKAFRFVHASPYDDIDTAYEAITTYLDGKNVVVSDSFIEEYVTDLTNPTDEALEVYIYVQPKEQPQDAPKVVVPDASSELHAHGSHEISAPDVINPAPQAGSESKQEEGAPTQAAKPADALTPSTAAPSASQESANQLNNPPENKPAPPSADAPEKAAN